MNRRSVSVMNWRNRVKIKLIEYKGGKCSCCGYDKPVPSCYDFHHEDPKKKDFSISGKSWSYDRLKKEVDKCVLLCKLCHSELHWNKDQKSRTDRHNDLLFVQKLENKNCVCGNSFEPKNSKQKFCSLDCSHESHRKVDRPSKEELEQEIAINSMVELGKKYGVSDNAVRKWAKSYGLIG